MTKYRVKLTTRAEVVEAYGYQIEHGGTLSFYREMPGEMFNELFLSFNVRDWVRVEEVEENATGS